MPPFDAHSIGHLYEAHGPAVFRRCRDILGDEQAALDATQDVFVKAMRHGEGFRGEASPTTWLYRVSTNLCLNRLRDQRGRRAKLEGVRGDVGGGGAQAVKPGLTGSGGMGTAAAIEHRALVRSLLALVDDQTRQVAVYYYFDGMTHEEIATMVGLSRPTVRKRLEHFKDRARRHLGLSADASVGVALLLAFADPSIWGVS